MAFVTAPGCQATRDRFPFKAMISKLLKVGKVASDQPLQGYAGHEFSGRIQALEDPTNDGSRVGHETDLSPLSQSGNVLV